MTSFVFKQSVVDSLREEIDANLAKYIESDDTWIDGHFHVRSLYAMTKLPELPEDLLLLPNGDEYFDGQNSERIYNALAGLTLAQASDPRLWTYFSHLKFWRYMRARWPITPITTQGEAAIKERTKRKNRVVSRYFLVGDKARGLTRNGIARLWWAGYCC